MTSNNARRRRAKDAAKLAHGSAKPQVMSAISSVMGICKLCDRAGLIDSTSGACTGWRLTGQLRKPFEMRSVRCQAIKERLMDRQYSHG